MGGNGSDRPTGDSNSNILKGGNGRDVLNGGADFDTADFSDKSLILSIFLIAGRSTFSITDETDTLISIENLTGGSGSDKLTDDSGANLLCGGAGDDFLKGGAGADTLNGGTGLNTADFSDKSASGVVNRSYEKL